MATPEPVEASGPSESLSAATGAWLAVRFPIIWRTRLLLIVSLAIGAAIAAVSIASALPLALHSIPTLTIALMLVGALTFLTYGLLALLVLDVARRATPLFAPRHLGATFLCVAAAAAAIQLPRHLFVDTAVQRIATLQSDEEVEALVTKHEPYGFWRCRDALEVPLTLRGDLERDLRRYGLRTRFRTVPDYTTLCEESVASQRDGRVPRRQSWLLQVWERADVPDSYDPGRVNTIVKFEGRIRHVQAAQQYGSGTGPFASRVTVPRLIATALGAACVTTLFVATSRYRSRAVAGVRRLSAASWWPATFGFDEYIAARWPTLWASRVHRSLVQLLLVALVLVRMPPQIGVSGPGMVYLALLAVGVLALLAPHADAASGQADFRQSVGVLVIHAGVFLALSMTILLIVAGYRNDANASTPLAVICVAMVACGWVQAARAGSIYTAFGAIALSLVLLAVVTLSTIDETRMMVAHLVLTGAFAVLVRWSFGVQARPTLRRLIVGGLVIQTSYTWVLAASIVFDRIQSLAFAVIALALYLSSTIAILYLSRHSRRALAVASR
jgi:hypothetical protein